MFESSQRETGSKRTREDNTQNTKYFKEQTDVLEKVYAECSNPNIKERDKIKSDYAVLDGVENKQIKIWFQNRRSREKQKNESNGLGTTIKNLKDEITNLKDDIDQLKTSQAILENKYERLLKNCQCGAATKAQDLDRLPEVNSSDSPISLDADNIRLTTLAEEAKEEFCNKLSKAEIDWNVVSPLKGPSWVSNNYIHFSSACEGAIITDATVPLGLSKTVEILKDRQSWSRDCKNMNICKTYLNDLNGGTIEVIYTQCYAPTTIASAQDYLTVRYTSVVENSKYLICEKSISNSEAISSSPAALEFVRGKILTSGYMIQPLEDGSHICFLEHLDLEASSVPDVVRPLYTSPHLLAKKNIYQVLQYIDHLAKEDKNVRNVPPYYNGPPPLTFGKKLTRGFNDATNGFRKDGWKFMQSNPSNDVYLSIKKNSDGLDPEHNNVICVKTSLIILNVSPAKLVEFLKDRRPDWLNVKFDDQSLGLAQATGFAFPGPDTHNLSGSPMSMGNTNYEDEILEVTRFNRVTNHRLIDSSEDIHHVQITNGMEETDFGACSEFIFAPFQRELPDEAGLLSSGFRTFFLGSNTNDWQVASSSENAATVSQSRSLLTMVFQFPFESHCQEVVASMARRFIQHVIQYVKSYFVVLMPTEPSPVVRLTAGPSELTPTMNSTQANQPTEPNIVSTLTYFSNLIHSLHQSYRLRLGEDLLGLNYVSTDPEFVFNILHHYQTVVLCFSLKPMPLCIYSNLVGLRMFDTSSQNLHYITVDSVLEASDLQLEDALSIIEKQGFNTLSGGYFLSLTGGYVAYERVDMWFVPVPDASSVPHLGLVVIGPVKRILEG